MRYAVLSYSTKNLGDEIQSIAARRFLPRVDAYIDRDLAPLAAGAPLTLLIANGWYCHAWERFGFPETIRPLFVSVHLASKPPKHALAYLRRYAPIGCRDLSTLKLLEDAGVPAFFSGCLTLTLENDIKERTHDVVIADVDPTAIPLIPKTLLDQALWVTHATNLGSVSDPLSKPTRVNLAGAVASHVPYMMPLVERWYHRISLDAAKAQDPGIKDLRFTIAEGLLSVYKRARLVITSRLHTALPCAAFGTPVVFLTKDPNDRRFAGLADFLAPIGINTVSSASINWHPDPKSLPAFVNTLRERMTESLAGL